MGSVTPFPVKSDVIGGDDVVIVNSQPPLKEPMSPPKSSTTYKLHVPFGAVPWKTVSDVTY